MRSKENLTLAAVSGSPLANFRPDFSVQEYVVGVAKPHFSAASGLTVVALPETLPAERRRCLAVQRLQEGYSADEVADVLGVDPRSVRRWAAAFRDQGPRGLAARPVPGRPGKLTATIVAPRGPGSESQPSSPGGERLSRPHNGRSHKRGPRGT